MGRLAGEGPVETEGVPGCAWEFRGVALHAAVMLSFGDNPGLSLSCTPRMRSLFVGQGDTGEVAAMKER